MAQVTVLVAMAAFLMTSLPVLESRRTVAENVARSAKNIMRKAVRLERDIGRKANCELVLSPALGAVGPAINAYFQDLQRQIYQCDNPTSPTSATSATSPTSPPTSLTSHSSPTSPQTSPTSFTSPTSPQTSPTSPTSPTPDPRCPPEWTAISATHTMCLTDVGTDIVLTQGQKTELLDRHNALRRTVQPTATDMSKMAWDDELALVASKWARQCQLGHDAHEDRAAPSLPGVWVGQNAAYSSQGGSMMGSIEDGWWAEKDGFAYGSGAIGTATVGHYTQMSAARAVRVGCGQADCEGNLAFRNVLVCNYAAGLVGQQASDLVTPYTSGTTCDACPNTCVDSLCDCSGKVCLNGGTLDIATCTCGCVASQYADMHVLYTGDTCETLECPESDPSFPCGQWSAADCHASNVWPACPHMCGICPS